MFPILNEKEKLIIDGVLKDLITDQIAAELNYSFGTVKECLMKLFKKHKVNSKTGLAVNVTKLNILHDIEFLRNKGFNAEQNLFSIETSLNKEISDKNKLYDDKKSKQGNKDTRFQFIASEYSLNACKNNGGGRRCI